MKEEETKEQQGTIIIYKDKVTEVRLVEAEEDDDGNIIKDCYCKEVDITDSLPYFINNFCKIKSDVTLRDFVSLLNKHFEFFNILQYQNFFASWVKYILNAKKSDLPKDDGPNTIQKFRVYASLNVDQFIDEDDKQYDDVALSYDIDFECGKITEEYAKKNSYKSDRIGKTEYYGLMGSDISDYADYNIYIDSNLYFTNTKYKDKENFEYIVEIYKNFNITLNQLIEAIFYEISFHGTPEDTQKTNSQIREISEKIK